MIPLNHNLSPLKRSPIRLFTNLARETEDCVLLTIGEPDFDTPQAVCAAVKSALDSGRTHYAPNQGTAELRQAVAEFETNRGNPTGAEQVLITVGSCHALFTALLGILNPGEEVIIPTPAFNLYDTITRIAGGVPVAMDLIGTGFQITRELLEQTITPKTKAIILNSPCNPTGTVLSRESLEAVKQAVLGKPVFVISDNVYSGLSDTPCPDLCLDSQIKEQMLLCQSFSKPYAMTGWRVGYLVAPQYVMDRLLLLSAAEITAVPTFLQDAAVTALRTDVSGMREIYRKRRDYVCGRLTAMGLEYPQPEGAFYVFPDIRKYGIGADEFCARMIREAHVAAVPGTCFGAEGHIRISYCNSESELRKGMDRLEAFLASL